MVIDLVHYRLYKKIIEYVDVPLGCREYFHKKEEQMMDFLLIKARDGILTASDTKVLNRLLERRRK